jgi:hypothetical protein
MIRVAFARLTIDPDLRAHPSTRLYGVRLNPPLPFGACRLVNGRQPVHARPNRTFPTSEPPTPGDSSGSPA